MLKTSYISLADIKIAYTEHGSGPTLILLHGNSLNKSIFHHWQTGFLNNFHTYAIDTRGHGESVSEDTRYTYEQFADDTIRFCQEKQIQSATLIGYSDGANTGLFLGKKAPNLFPKMILLSPEYSPSGTKPLPLFGMTVLRNLFRFVSKWGVNHRWFLRFDLMLRDYGLTPEYLREIRSAVLIIYASNDLIKKSHIEEIHSLISRSELVEIAHCDHMTMLLKSALQKEINRYLRTEPLPL